MQKVKMWVIEHFRILPTDERYKELTEEQMELLFCSFLSLPEDRICKIAHERGATKKDVVDGLPKDILEEMGYNEEEMKKIADELIISNFPE